MLQPFDIVDILYNRDLLQKVRGVFQNVEIINIYIIYINLI